MNLYDFWGFRDLPFLCKDVIIKEMENTEDRPPYYQFPTKENLPGAVTSLVTGIVGLILVICCQWLNILGVIFGIAAIVSGMNTMKKYAENPSRYHINDLQKAKTGKVLGIITLGIASLIWIIFILILIIGSADILLPGYWKDLLKNP